MQKISKTFCPSKWDDLHINLESQFAYGCCKATPVPINNDFKKILDKQKENLLNDIQDPSCEYCWKLERHNLPSQRHKCLEQFSRSYDEYIANCDPLEIEINLGNECNFQCIYCNPKFSSKWHADILKKPYKIFSDKFNYTIPINEVKKNIDAENLIYQLAENTKRIALIGGEPFYNKKFFQILENINVDTLRITTNLSAKTANLQRFFEISSKFNKVEFQISIDSTGSIAEFTRYGLNYKEFYNKLCFIIDKCPGNVNIKILSLMTSLTILDLKELKKEILPLVKNNAIKWDLSYCTNPVFQSFDTLQDKFKTEAILELDELENYTAIYGANIVAGAIKVSQFNKTLYMQLLHFLKDFAERRKINIPFDLN